MGIDGMRVGGGRCPPLIVAGLIVASFLLVCNWWSLSTENNELLRQIDGLTEQLKLSAEQNDQCMILRSNYEQRYKNTEAEVASLHVQLGQERDSEKRLDEAASMCRAELDSLRKLDFTKNATLEALRVDKISINSQLEARKEENKKLQDELDKLREELNTLKLLQDSTADKKTVVETQALPRGKNPVAPQLGPVPVEAVQITPSGQQGILNHGIPVLPRDPPGAVRQVPRFSVTMLKGAPETALTNETQNGGNQEDQENADANNLELEETNADVPGNLEDEGVEQESFRDQEHLQHATNKDIK